MKSLKRFPGALWRVARGRARREDGQALLITVGALLGLIMFAGLVVDVGRLYLTQRQLQNAVEASALAASQELPRANDAQTYANKFSMCANCDGGAAGRNNVSGVTASVPDVTVKCLTNVPTSVTPTGVQCQNHAGATTNGSTCQNPTPCNAVVVQETASWSPFFIGGFGLPNNVVSSLTSATAKSTVVMRGGIPHPLNIMIVLDTSGSMTAQCTDANNANYTVKETNGAQTYQVNGTSTKLDCAKQGIRSLLSSLLPCDPATADPNNGNCIVGTSTPEDKVGLVIFPAANANIQNATPSFAAELDCSWTMGSGDVGYGNTSGYVIVPPDGTFKTSDALGAPLSGASTIIKAVSWSSCMNGVWPPTANATNSRYGAEAPGGPGTAFSNAIGKAALAIKDLPGQGVIILLSDGDANTNSAGTNPCSNAVQTAQQIALPPAQGGFSDWVFSVGYDIPATGCSLDSNANSPYIAGITPYTTMQQIASDPTRFYCLHPPSLGGGRNEIERISVNATGGSFTLTYPVGGGTKTANIARNATSGTVQSRLTTAFPALNGNISVGNPGGGGNIHTWDVTFNNALGQQPLVPSPDLSGASSASDPLTGVGSVTVTTTQSGVTGPSATCNGVTASNLNQIFQDIGNDLKGARLVPNG